MRYRTVAIAAVIGLLSVSVRAAVDTADRRYSMLNMTGYVLPVPNSEIDAEDRLHLLGLYAGIAAGEPAAPADPAADSAKGVSMPGLSIGL